MLRAKSLMVGALVGVLTGVLGLEAQAAPVFEFNKRDRSATTALTYQSEGVQATVTAEYVNRRGNNDVASVQTWAGHGLGVVTKNDNSHQVDGKGREIVWISLSEVIDFTLAKFSYTGNKYDEVTVLDGEGNTLGEFSLANNRRNADTNTNTHTIDLSTLEYTGSVIGFQASHFVEATWSYWKKEKEQLSAWKLVALGGEIPPTQVVPTPAAAGLGLLGLAGLALRRRTDNA